MDIIRNILISKIGQEEKKGVDLCDVKNHSFPLPNENQEILLKIEELQEQLNELKSICNEKENW